MKKRIFLSTLLVGACLCATTPIFAQEATTQNQEVTTKPAVSTSTIKNQWKQVDGAWYYYNEQGESLKQSFWNSYYFHKDGKMASSEWVEDVTVNAWYYLKGDGSYARSEWQGSYYLKQNGKMAVSEWIFEQNYDAWYYLKSDGNYAHDEEKDGRYLESDGKMRETEAEKAKRQFGNSPQTQQAEKKALEQAIQWLESEDSISINEEYAKRLNQYGSTDQGKNQENISALNTITKSLLKQNQKEIGAISNTLLAKYTP